MSGIRQLSSSVLRPVVTVLLCLSVLSAPATARSTPFYEGKMIRLVVGYAPGGGFDTFARLLARHMGNHLPGNPGMIVQNMSGAGSLIAANRVYAARGDGLTLVTFHFGMVVQALIGNPGVKFDPDRYIWLGHPSLGALPEVLWIRSELPIQSLADMKKRKEPLNVGATSPETSAALAGKFLRYVGLPIKNVYGYRGSAPTMAALERKEIDGRMLPQDTMQTTYRRFIDEGIVRPIIALGEDPKVEPLPGVATLEDLNLDAEQRQLADFLTGTWSLLRLYAIPPGTPPDRVKLLRQAFMKSMQSPEFVRDAKRQGVIIAPTSGEAVERIVNRLRQTPADILEKYKGFVALR